MKHKLSGEQKRRERLVKVELKTNPEYEALLPKLSVEQYEALKNSIMAEGQHYPIAYNVEGEVLDGHHRLKVCKELGIEPKLEAEPRTFKDKLDEKQFVLEVNLIRRHLDTWYRIIVAKPLLAIYREKAERRRLATLKQGTEIPDTQNIGERVPQKIRQAKVQPVQLLHLSRSAMRAKFLVGGQPQ